MKVRRIVTAIFVGLGFCSLSWGQSDASVAFRTPSAAPQQEEQPVTAATSLDTFQFNGVMQFGGRVRISVYDTKSQKNVWLTEGQTGELGLSFGRYDAKNDTVVLMQGGIMKKLSLNQIRIEELKISSQTPPPPPIAGPAVVGQPNNERVETDEEARARIQRVAEEIRRRRAERRKQLEQRSQGR